MTYRELLERYQAGQLDEETRRRVESDIQRQEAIGDYLFETGGDLPDLPPAPEGEDAAGDSGDLFTRQIQRAVRRMLIRTGVTVGAVVLALVLLAQAVLPKAVSQFYYDPTEPIHPAVPRPRIDLDLAVWTELFLPGGFRDNAYATDLGYGKYALTFSQTRTGDPDRPAPPPNAVSGMLTRDRLTLYDPNAFDTSRRLFLRPEDLPEGVDAARENSFYHAEQNLVEDRWYTAYLSLAEDVDYETLYRWCVDRQLAGNDLWFHLNAEAPADTSGWWGGFGFAVVPPRSWTLPEEVEEVYPALFEDFGWHFEDDEMSLHVQSLLAYTRDHPEFTRVMGNLVTDHQKILDSAIADIQDQGLWMDGFAVVGTREELLALRDEPLISYIYTIPMA